MFKITNPKNPTFDKHITENEASYVTYLFDKAVTKNKPIILYYKTEKESKNSVEFNKNIGIIMNDSNYQNKFEFILAQPSQTTQLSHENNKLLNQCTDKFCLINPAANKVQSYKLRDLSDIAVFRQVLDQF